jgi:glycerol-3-phosphate dehydrogenase
VIGSECIDLLVVGGGINGAGIARDAAGRGLSVTLVEQDDLASATSSASTKLVHGGLRYLELLEFRLVREALAERERLLAIAPHIIRPMRFVLPHVRGLRPRWLIRLGLLFYDHAGRRRSLPGSRGIRLAGAGFGAPLDPLIAHGFLYSDCWVDDSRLVVLNALDAAERGARILPRTRFVSAVAAGDGTWTATCEDRCAARRFSLRCRAIVNAAGPWVEPVLRQVQLHRHAGSQVRLVKGSHIVVRKLYDGEHAYTLQHPDGRVVFAIPYEDEFTVIGTTDVAYAGDPGSAAISAEETGYLCGTISRYFPGRRPGPADIVWSYVGVRPLFDDESEDISKVTRDYKLEVAEGAGGAMALSVYGGKITTYRRLAEAAMTRLLARSPRPRGPWTSRAPLPGGDLPRGDPAAFLADCRRRWPELPAGLLRRLARSYGTRIEQVLGAARSTGQLGRPLGAGLTEAEVQYLRCHEWARHASDVLWRRTKLGLHMSPEQQADVERALHETAHCSAGVA